MEGQGIVKVDCFPSVTKELLATSGCFPSGTNSTLFAQELRVKIWLLAIRIVACFNKVLAPKMLKVPQHRSNTG